MAFLRNMPWPPTGPLLAVLVGSAACAHTAPAPAPAPTQPAQTTVGAASPKQTPELPARQALPLVLRETLTATMGRHGEELTFLLESVVFLRYDETEALARLLADEPKLGRPAAGDVESLNALLPDAFFVHQDQLSQRAKALAAAAKAKDDGSLVKAFGSLTETCVGCHAAYLHDDLNPTSQEEEAP
jgi:hypothetical protein